MKYGFIIDNRKCIGCHACTVACKSEHEVAIGVNRTWVKYIEKGTFPESRRIFSVMRCNHCAKAPCVEICPVGALFKRDDGIVDFNNQRCIACKSCVQACPYDSIYIDPDTNTAAKCNYCAHRIDQGLNPACVNICPEQAIIAGDLDDPRTEISRLLSRKQVQARKVEKGTTPKLYYIEGDAASLNPMAAPPTNQYQQFEQNSGVGHFAYTSEDRIVTNEGKFKAYTTGSKAPYEKETLAGNGIEIENAGGERYKLTMEKVRRTHDKPAKGILWGWQVPAYLWSKGISAGAFLITFLSIVLGVAEVSKTTQWFTTATSFVFLGFTMLFLVLDLDQPKRFIYVMLRPQFKSWLTRGGYLLAAFGGSLALWVAGELLSMQIFSDIAIGLGILIASILAIYTAFLFGQAKGRDFWQSPALPLHMMAQSIMAGAAVLLIGSMILPDQSPEWIALLGKILLVALGANTVITLTEVMMPHPTIDAKLTARMITGKRFGLLFYAGTLLIGNILPFALLLANIPAGVVIAAAVLIGVYITEHIWVKAPQLIPLS